MGHIKIAFWGSLALLVGLWLLANPLALQSSGFFSLRNAMVQLSGVLAMGCMSLAMRSDAGAEMNDAVSKCPASIPMLT